VLILSRKPGDTIVIGDGIRLVVLECDRREVRIGIEAPPDVKIVRGEIVNQIADENRRAGVSGDTEWLKAIPPRKKR
jgi:carbon storage regulator